jgi:hypothetical protein
MAQYDYGAARALIAEHPDLADFDGPKDEQLVAAAEQLLGLSFPADYRNFLLEFGAGSFGAKNRHALEINSRRLLPPSSTASCKVGWAIVARMSLAGSTARRASLRSLHTVMPAQQRQGEQPDQAHQGGTDRIPGAFDARPYRD